MLAASDLTDHFHTVFYELASVFSQRHLSSFATYFLKYLIFVQILTVLKNGRKNEYSKLIFWKLEEVAKNDDVGVFNKLRVTVLNHPLNDPTAVLVNTVLYEVRINHFDYVFDLLTLSLATHHY